MSAGSAAAAAAGLTVVGLAGLELAPREAELLRRFQPSGVILFRRNAQDAAQLTRLCAAVQQCRVPGALPLLICADQEGGSVAPLAAAIGRPPAALALGLADDLALTRRVHAETARRAAACGVRWLLAPVADVVAGENPVVATRAFGGDPQRVAAHVAAAVQGLADGGALSCAKHWPGHGRPTLDSHVDVPTLDVPAAELERTEMPPFASAIAAGVDAVMAAHLLVPQVDGSGVVASRSAVMLQQWLRERLGFAGAIASDALEMAGFQQAPPHGALTAGIDLLLFAGSIEAVAEQLDALNTAVHTGQVDRARVAQARDHVTRLRARSGALLGGQPAAGTPARAGEPHDDAPYALARAHGVLWIPADGPSRARAAFARSDESGWSLVDAASADRLLRAEPGAGLSPLPAPASSLLAPALQESLGAPRSVLMLPSAADPSLGPRELAARLGSLPQGGGWIVASLRPFAGERGDVWAAQLRWLRPAWIGVLGDLSLARLAARVWGEVPILAVPGASPEDAGLLGELLLAAGATPGSPRPS